MPFAKSVTGYRFLDKDPVIDYFREAMRRSGLTYAQIAVKSGITTQTLRKWDLGETRRPQAITLRFAMEACGFTEVWLDAEGHKLNKGLDAPPKARVVKFPRKAEKRA